jgi:REP element-mobilizing transposase RayT
MPNTYTQLYVQFVFAVKGRQNLINETFRDELEKIMCGIANGLKCKAISIYCNPDHVHFLVGMSPDVSPSKLMEQVKSSSSKWLNEKKYIQGRFEWQRGFGAFTYSKSQLNRVVGYIMNQPQHHKKQSFREEYLLLLEKFEVPFNSKFLFEWYE